MIRNLSLRAWKTTNALVVSEFLIEAQKNFLDGRAGKRAISNKEISENLNISNQQFRGLSK